MHLGLIGRGISKSPSPVMQEAAMRSYGIPGHYDLYDVTALELPAVVQDLRAGTLDGCNVTIPYKRALATTCERLEGDAAILDAVNTLWVSDGRLTGDNTDALGFEIALSSQKLWPPRDCRAVIIGAGAAASAAALAMSRVPASDVAIVARRDEGALQLVNQLRDVAPVRSVGWSGPTLRSVLAGADIVINSTPVGVDSLPFHAQELPRRCTVADMRYRPRPVDLCVAAEKAHHRACDGLEMLLCQGMLSFQRWTGLEPPWDAARAALTSVVEAGLV